MKDRIFARAAVLAGELGEKQEELLRLFSETAAQTLAARLKTGMTVESCREVFPAAGAMLALAALIRLEDGVQEFKAGDLTVKQGNRQEEAARCLEEQAWAVMAPFLQDGFVFTGV